MTPWRQRSYYSSLGAKVLAFWAIFILIYAGGWIWNLVKLFHMASVMTGEGALRIAGIFVPFLGPVMGYFV